MLTVERARQPLVFFEARGSYAASWQCRLRRVLCALGVHGWMLGPYDREGRWVDAGGVHRDPVPGEHPYVCGFGSPWCRARRVLTTVEFLEEFKRREHPGPWRRLVCRLAGWLW